MDRRGLSQLTRVECRSLPDALDSAAYLRLVGILDRLGFYPHKSFYVRVGAGEQREAEAGSAKWRQNPEALLAGFWMWSSSVPGLFAIAVFRENGE